MKKYFGSSAALCLLIAGFGFAGPGKLAAQDQAGGTTPPPKVLEIITEYLKPGQEGAAHYKTESAFPRAFAAAQWPQHYFAMDALSGRGRTLFFVAYDSFEALQKDFEATQKNATLSDELDKARVADGALLDSYETSSYAYREDLSLRAPVKIEEMRYFEILILNVRPGHRQEFEALGKMYVSAYEKVPDAHWAAFEKIYGTQGGSRFIIATPMKSLAEVDREITEDRQMASSMSSDQMKKLEELSAAAIESSESNVYAINPKLSYPRENWVKADPSFWGQK
jgi:hypothetical protein